MTLIERAAQAVIDCERNMKGVDLGSPLWGKNIARAVLMAIREPSEAMLNFTSFSDEWVERPMPNENHPIWQAMIDAALEETP